MLILEQLLVAENRRTSTEVYTGLACIRVLTYACVLGERERERERDS